MKKELERLSEIRKELQEIYREKVGLEKVVVEEIISNKKNNDEKKNVVEINETEIVTLKWLVDKKIDYEKLKEKYPDIYELGLILQFSTHQALKSVEKSLLNNIIRDCTTINPHYEIKIEKKGKREKYEQRFSKKSV